MAITNIEYQLTDGDEAAVDTERGGGQERYLVDFDMNDAPSARKFMALDGIGWGGATQIPAIWSSHFFRPFIYVINKTARVFGSSPFVWEVTVTYESVTNPLDLPPTVSWSFASTNEPFDHANFLDELTDPGTPVVIPNFPTMNSSKEAFDPPLTEVADDLVYRTNFNQEFFNHALAAEVKNSINETEWKGFALGSAKMVDYSATERRAGELIYHNLTAEVHIRKEKWNTRVVDQGFRTIRLDAPGGSPVLEDGRLQFDTIVDANNNPLSQPVLLDGHGQKLADGADPVLLTYNKKKGFEFNDLGLA